MFGFLKRIFFGGVSQPPLPPPGRLGIDILARRLGVSVNDLRNIPIAYSTFRVPKRTGGSRTIYAPAAPLKAMQRQILHRLLRGLKSHPCATGFERGHSIVTNALPHVGQEVVIKMDIRDFFSSTSARRVEAFFRTIGWNADAADMLSRLCTYQGSLPQGAPTSPRLSNLVNRRMDARLGALAESLDLRYSRYADDITLSGSERHTWGGQRTNLRTLAPGNTATRRINDLIYLVKLIVAEEGYKLHTAKKLRIARRHDRQIVTGLVVNQKVGLPRTTRRWLRAVEHRLLTTGQATMSPQQLSGWRALQSMIANQSSPQSG